jgi:hypothetical protein
MEGNFESKTEQPGAEALTEYVKEKRDLIIEEAEGLRNLHEAKKELENFEATYGIDELLAKKAKGINVAEGSEAEPVQPGWKTMAKSEEGRSSRRQKQVGRPRQSGISNISIEALQKIAVNNALIGNLDKAVGIAELLEEKPVEKDLQFQKEIAVRHLMPQLANFYLEQGDLERAEALLVKIGTQDPYNVIGESGVYDAYFKLIDGLIEQGNIEKAIYLTDTLYDKPKSFAFLLERLSVKNEYKEVEELIYQMDDNPKVDVLLHLVKFEIQRGNKEIAGRYIKYAEESAPNLKFPGKNEGWVRYEISGKQKQIEGLKKQLDGDEPEKQVSEPRISQKAVEAARRGNIEEALAYCKQLEHQQYEDQLDLSRRYGGRTQFRFDNQDVADIQFEIAAFYHSAGDSEKAEKFLNLSYGRTPDDSRARANTFRRMIDLGYKRLVYKELRSSYHDTFEAIDSNKKYYADPYYKGYDSARSLIDIQCAIGDFEGAQKTEKYWSSNDFVWAILRSQAAASRRQLRECEQRGIGDVDKDRVLSYAVQVQDKDLIESLGTLMSKEEREKSLTHSSVSSDDLTLMAHGRSASGIFNFEKEYDGALVEAKNLLSQYIIKGEVEDRPILKKAIDTLDELAPEDAADLITSAIRETDSENPHIVRLLKYLLDSSDESMNEVAIGVLHQKNLPERYFSYVAERLVGAKIKGWERELGSALPPEKEIMEAVREADPILHNFIATKITNFEGFGRSHAMDLIAENISEFKGLDSEMAKRLDDYEWWDRGVKYKFSVIDHISSFKELDNSFALKAIGKKEVDRVLIFSGNFAPFDQKIFHDFFDEQIKNENWPIVAGLSKIDVCKEKFNELFASYQQIAADTNAPFRERRKALDFLADLAKEGAVHIEEQFIEIIQQRSKQKEAPEGKWGLDPAQEAAFYTLMRLDNQAVNGALFKMLLNDNVPETVKQAVVRKLLSEGRDFGSGNMTLAMETWFRWARSHKDEKIEWRDLSFLNAIRSDIPSTELRGRSFSALKVGDLIDAPAGESVYSVWEKKYKNIPEHTFLQLRALVSDTSHTAGAESEERDNLLGKFQNLYKSIAKENSKQEEILYGIVNSLELDKRLLGALIKKFAEIEFGTRQDAEAISKLLRQLSFLDKISSIDVRGNSYDNRDYDYFEYDDDYYDRNEPQVAPSENAPSTKEEVEKEESEKDKSIKATAAVIEHGSSLATLNDTLNELIGTKIREILPHDDITAEKIQTLEERWGDLEPIFTYVGRYPELKGYIAEIVAHTDSTENWKKWRYNKESKLVEGQIGVLNADELSVWARDYNVALGDLDLNESENTKPQEVRDILTQAIIDFKHIYNPDEGQKGSQYIQSNVEAALKKTADNPADAENILRLEVASFEKLAADLNVIIQSKSMAQFRQILDTTFAENAEVSVSSKTKNLLGSLSNLLSSELRREVNKTYQKLDKDNTKRFNINECLTPEARAYLLSEIERIEARFSELAASSELADKLGVGQNAETKDLYARRNELSTVIHLTQLANLNNRLIATNQISEREAKSGESLSGTLKDLQKTFEGTAFELDLKNIETKIHQRSELHHKRRIAMVFTDDPQMLWQVGKYPLGNGSCQHYAEGSYANRLMGYVGDANCKVAYMVDLNYLPETSKEMLGKGVPTQEVIESVPKIDLLKACVARVIVKLGENEQGKPAIVLEPTYTNINKGDSSMDNYFDLFAKNFIAHDMGADVYRGQGSEKVSLGKSRNPNGQYEDLSLDAVKKV